MIRELELPFGSYGVSREQACIMCHLSAECHGCCLRCGQKDSCGGQTCSQPFRDHEGQRFETWMYLVGTTLTELQEFLPQRYRALVRKKYKSRWKK